MDIKDYKFHIGDEVITAEGIKGRITDICTYINCEEREFYELEWEEEDNRNVWPHYITNFDAEYGFNEYYKIGDYRFNDFDKKNVLNEISRYEEQIQKLEVQLRLMEETMEKEKLDE